MDGRDSHFDGGVLENLGINLVTGLVGMLTLGIALPWMICWKQKWVTKNTVIEGKRLAFDGTGGQLFGNYIKWFLLTLITLGIYGFWVAVRMHQWIAKHTYFAE